MPRKRNFDQDHYQRRQFIFRRVVLDNRPTSIRELKELLNLENYDYKKHADKVKGDISEFKSVGCRITLRDSATPDPDDSAFVFEEGPHTDDDTVRENANQPEKALVAQLTASMICGIRGVEKDIQFWLPELSKLLEQWNRNRLETQFWKSFKAEDSARSSHAHKIPVSDFDEDSVDQVRSVLLHLNSKLSLTSGHAAKGTANDVLKLLQYTSDSLGRRFVTLRTNLYSFWAESSRMVAIDSGTTNILLARYLKATHIPIEGSELCSLTVCTNSRRIFEELGPSGVWIKTIIIGGQQLFRSPTIAGAMAEAFLRGVSILQFGMCVLGSTRIDLDRFAICSDSQEEASIKNLLMDRSSLRIVCVDNSKLQSGPGREGYRYASIDPKHIDLIITNSPFRTKNGKPVDEGVYDLFAAQIHAIEARGVPVLVATSDETFNYPGQELANKEQKIGN